MPRGGGNDDNRADQMTRTTTPTGSPGVTDERPDDWEDRDDGDDDGDDDNRANQLNPNNDAYWASRGEEQRG